jgi:hypothetical protein
MSLPIQPYLRHLNQADHNESLLNENCFPDPCAQLNSTYKDWNVTILFYTAFHYIQSYLVKNNKIYGYKTEFSSHKERNDYLGKISNHDPLIAKVVDEYIGLFNASCYARYTSCSYHYLKQNDICKYKKFVSCTLPKTLGII